MLERWGRLANNPNRTNYSTNTSHTHLWFGFTSSIFCRIRFFFCVFFARIIIPLHFSAQLLVIRMCASCIISSFFCWPPTERRTYYDELMITFSFVSADGAADISIRFLWRERHGDTERISGCWLPHKDHVFHGPTCIWFNGFFIFLFLTMHTSHVHVSIRACVSYYFLFVYFSLFFGSGQFEIYLLVSCLNTATRKKKNNEKSTGRWVVCENSDTRKTLMRICIQFCWFAAAVNDLLSNH